MTRQESTILLETRNPFSIANYPCQTELSGQIHMQYLMAVMNLLQKII